MKSIRYFPCYIEYNYFFRIIRTSIFFILISTLSSCCCLWYVDIDEPELYNKQKNNTKTSRILDLDSEKKPKKTKLKN